MPFAVRQPERTHAHEHDDGSPACGLGCGDKASDDDNDGERVTATCEEYMAAAEACLEQATAGDTGGAYYDFSGHCETTLAKEISPEEYGFAVQMWEDGDCTSVDGYLEASERVADCLP